jgi:hypothetical protein
MKKCTSLFSVTQHPYTGCNQLRGAEKERKEEKLRSLCMTFDNIYSKRGAHSRQSLGIPFSGDSPGALHVTGKIP